MKKKHHIEIVFAEDEFTSNGQDPALLFYKPSNLLLLLSNRIE